MLYLKSSKGTKLTNNYKKVEFIMTKQTVAEKFEAVAKVLMVAGAPTELIDFINERKAMHEKRTSNKKRGLTKTQKENLAHVEKINAFFFEQADPEVAYTSTEVAQAIGGEIADFTPQKMTALLKQVENVEKVSKATNDKKKVGYKAK